MKRIRTISGIVLVMLVAGSLAWAQFGGGPITTASPSTWWDTTGRKAPGDIGETTPAAGNFDEISIKDGGAASRVGVTDANGLLVWTDLGTLLSSGPYGVSWNETTDTYARTGLTSAVAVGTKPADSLMPVHAAMRPCVINDAGAVVYYLNPANITQKLDGSASTLTGADGQVVLEIPAFYERYSYVAPVHTHEISLAPLAGFTLNPAFTKDGANVGYRYMGLYEGVLYDTSASRYADGIYQTAWSCTFATADDSITANSRTAPFKNLSVGDKVTISGTVSNNTTVTVASLISDVKITTTENLTDETAAATVIQTQKDWTATTGDKLSSVSGKTPIIYGTRAQFRVAASNRGAGWRQLDWDLYTAFQRLYLVEYASFYSQSMIGVGITNVTDWPAYNDYNPIAKTGNANAVAASTANNAGSTSAATESTKYLRYRWVENPFGHLWKWVDGININNNVPYATNVAANWADDTATNYTALGITLAASDGYQATLAAISRGFLPLTVGASSSTKITDYYYQSSGWRVVSVGGASADGGAAGGFSLRGIYSSATAYRYVGGRVCF